MLRLIALFTLVACAFAEPEAEADPQFLWNSGMWSSGMWPYMSSYASIPTTAAKLVSPAVSYSAPLTYASWPYSSIIAKREAEGEAEAKPEADPQWLLNSGMWNSAMWPYMSSYAYPTTAAKLVSSKISYSAPLTYASWPYTYSSIIAKREAESEPEADPQWWNSGIWNSGMWPYMSSYAYPTTAAKLVSSPAISYSAPLTYSSWPYTYSSIIAKREAESEPEAGWRYGRYGYRGYYGYPRYSGYRSYGYGYAAPYRYYH